MSRKKFRLNESKLRRAEIEAFKNGLRLHFDSIALFEKKSYPSSFVLSVLSLEEFGKQRLIDEVAFRNNEHENDFSNARDFEKHLELYEKALLTHSVKQRFAIRDDFPFSIGYNRVQKKFFNRIFNEKGTKKPFDTEKQRATYIGFEGNKLKGRVQRPSDFVSRKKAQDQITAINDYLINFIIFVRQERWALDNEALTRYFSTALLRKLDRDWKSKHRDTRARVKAFLGSR